jgi:hypothetical protein
MNRILGFAAGNMMGLGFNTSRSLLGDQVPEGSVRAERTQNLIGGSLFGLGVGVRAGLLFNELRVARGPFVEAIAAYDAAVQLQRRMFDAFQKPISQTPELATLWNRAIDGVTDWDAARENFWRLVRNDPSQEADFARRLLNEAGFVFRQGSAPGTAPVLADHIRKFSEPAAWRWAGNDPVRRNIVQRLIDARKAGVPASDFSDRVLSVDHGLARTNGGSLLQPGNLWLMLLRDNLFKGVR